MSTGGGLSDGPTTCTGRFEEVGKETNQKRRRRVVSRSKVELEDGEEVTLLSSVTVRKVEPRRKREEVKRRVGSECIR